MGEKSDKMAALRLGSSLIKYAHMIKMGVAYM